MEVSSGKRERQTQELRRGSVREAINGEWFAGHGVGGGDDNGLREAGVDQLTDVCYVFVRSLDLFW